jgi:hypothetical protein
VRALPLLATPAIVNGRRKKGTRLVIIISHIQVERQTRQVQFYQGRKQSETLSSRDACSAGLNFGLRVCCASGSAASSRVFRALTLPILPFNAVDKQVDEDGARVVQGATVSVGDRRCHPCVGASSPHLTSHRTFIGSLYPPAKHAGAVDEFWCKRGVKPHWFDQFGQACKVQRILQQANTILRSQGFTSVRVWAWVPSHERDRGLGVVGLLL